MRGRLESACVVGDRAEVVEVPSLMYAPNRILMVASRLNHRRSNRARLMMDEAPDAVDEPEMIACSERCGLDQLDAHHVPPVARDNRVGFVTGDLRPAGALKDVAPAAEDGGASDNDRPSRMDAGDVVVIRPKPGQLRKISCREGDIEGKIGGEDGAFVGHVAGQWCPETKLLQREGESGSSAIRPITAFCAVTGGRRNGRDRSKRLPDRALPVARILLDQRRMAI